MMITTQAIWRSRPPEGLESVKQADEWKAEPTHWSNSEKGWKMVSSEWIALTHAIWLYVYLMQQNYKVPLQSGSGCCPASVPRWMKSGFVVNTVSKLYHQALGTGQNLKFHSSPSKGNAERFSCSNNLCFKLCCKRKYSPTGCITSAWAWENDWAFIISL